MPPLLRVLLTQPNSYSREAPDLGPGLFVVLGVALVRLGLRGSATSSKRPCVKALASWRWRIDDGRLVDGRLVMLDIDHGLIRRWLVVVAQRDTEQIDQDGHKRQELRSCPALRAHCSASSDAVGSISFG